MEKKLRENHKYDKWKGMVMPCPFIYKCTFPPAIQYVYKYFAEMFVRKDKKLNEK